MCACGGGQFLFHKPSVIIKKEIGLVPAYADSEAKTLTASLGSCCLACFKHLINREALATEFDALRNNVAICIKCGGYGDIGTFVH